MRNRIVILLLAAAGSLLSLHSAAQKPRLDRERMLREESARLLESKYEALLADARAAQAQGNLEAARASLAESLHMKARDPQALALLYQVDGQIAAIAAWNDRVTAIVTALEHDDWQKVEQQLRRLPEPPQSVRPLPHAELIPILRLGSRGRLKDARYAAAVLATAGRETAAASGFCRFVNSRARAESLPVGGVITGCVYLAALLASLHFGLRRHWLRAEVR
jgi:hypothetical protein